MLEQEHVKYRRIIITISGSITTYICFTMITSLISVGLFFLLATGGILECVTGSTHRLTAGSTATLATTAGRKITTLTKKVCIAWHSVSMSAFLSLSFILILSHSSSLHLCLCLSVCLSVSECVHAYVRLCVCVCVGACVRACVRACVSVCVRH